MAKATKKKKTDGQKAQAHHSAGNLMQSFGHHGVIPHSHRRCICLAGRKWTPLVFADMNTTQVWDSVNSGF